MCKISYRIPMLRTVFITVNENRHHSLCSCTVYQQWVVWMYIYYVCDDLLTHFYKFHICCELNHQFPTVDPFRANAFFHFCFIYFSLIATWVGWSVTASHLNNFWNWKAFGRDFSFLTLVCVVLTKISLWRQKCCVNFEPKRYEYNTSIRDSVENRNLSQCD